MQRGYTIGIKLQGFILPFREMVPECNQGKIIAHHSIMHNELYLMSSKLEKSGTKGKMWKQNPTGLFQVTVIADQCDENVSCNLVLLLLSLAFLLFIFFGMSFSPLAPRKSAEDSQYCGEEPCRTGRHWRKEGQRGRWRGGVVSIVLVADVWG